MPLHDSGPVRPVKVRITEPEPEPTPELKPAPEPEPRRTSLRAGPLSRLLAWSIDAALLCSLLAAHLYGATLLVDALDRLSAGTIEPRPQRHLSCPFRARYVKPGEPLIDWAATPIEQVFHVLRGALPLVDLLPPAPFPLGMLGFRASSFEHGTPLRPPGTYFIRRGRVAIAHVDGHVQLHAIVQPSRVARLARAWWQKAILRSGNG